MMEEEQVPQPTQNPAPFMVAQAQYRGRTWADVFASGFWLVIGIAALIGAYLVYTKYEFRIPYWIGVAIASSFLWRPFLRRVASEGSLLILVDGGAGRLTEYRVGSRYPMMIDGTPLDFYSESGVRRLYLSDLEVDESGVAHAVGGTMAGFSQFDFVRDVTVLRRINEAFLDHLRGERITKELIGVRVEEQVAEYSESWLRMLYGELDPKDIEQALAEVEEKSRERMDALHEEMENTEELVIEE